MSWDDIPDGMTRYYGVDVPERMPRYLALMMIIEQHMSHLDKREQQVVAAFVQSMYGATQEDEA